MTWDQVAALGPVATALAAVVAFSIGLTTVRQRAAADRRDQWWKRAQWSLDLTLEEDPDRRAVGFAALEVLATSELAGPEEARLLEVAWQGELDDSDNAPGHHEGDEGDVRADAEDDGEPMPPRRQ